MRTATYESVLKAASLLWSGQQSPSSDEAAELNIYINRRLREGWEAGWWRDVMLVEERTFRPAWDAATTYSAGDEVYDAASEKYFQSLQDSNLNEPPTTDDVENSAYWAECASGYSGDDWADGATYAVGDQVHYDTDGEYYQCIEAHTASGTLDDTKFSVLTPFVRSIDPEEDGQSEIGEVRRVWTEDPQVEPGAYWTEAEWLNGVLVVRGTANVVWLEFRKPAPDLTGDDWDATETYATGDQVYDSASGDYYVSLADSNTGNACSTSATKWELLGIPYVLAQFIAQAAFADAVRADDRADKYLAEEQRAQQLLEQALRENDRRGGTARRLAVTTRI